MVKNDDVTTLQKPCRVPFEIKTDRLWMSDRSVVLPHRLPPQQVGALVEGRGHGFGAAIIRIVFEKGGMRNVFN